MLAKCASRGIYDIGLRELFYIPLGRVAGGLPSAHTRLKQPYKTNSLINYQQLWHSNSGLINSDQGAPCFQCAYIWLLILTYKIINAKIHISPCFPSNWMFFFLFLRLHKKTVQRLWGLILKLWLRRRIWKFIKEEFWKGVIIGCVGIELVIADDKFHKFKWIKITNPKPSPNTMKKATRSSTPAS